MNDDPSPSSATRAGRSAEASLDGDDDRARAPEHPLVQRYDTTSRARRQDGRRRRKKPRKKRNPGLKKKLAFVTHLLRGLDTLVFAELSALYYMECVVLVAAPLGCGSLTVPVSITTDALFFAS
jgi:hypothetical protein